MPQVGLYAPALVDKRTGEQYPGPELFGASDDSFAVKCPYGKPRDQLWVKETWRTSSSLNHCKPTDLVQGAPIEYVADGWVKGHGMIDKGKTRVSLFMRRWMSRITLEVTAVRVERLQDISEEDAKAEGVNAQYSLAGYDVLTDTISVFVTENYVGGIPKPGDDWQGLKVKVVHPRPSVQTSTARDQYRALWTRINGPASWAANPWVWTIEFRRVTP
jgi:hypothetical protein